MTIDGNLLSGLQLGLAIGFGAGVLVCAFIIGTKMESEETDGDGR